MVEPGVADAGPVFTTVRSADAPTVVDTLLASSPGFGSVVPAGGVALAVFDSVVPSCGAKPRIVNVTLDDAGSVVIVLVTVLPATSAVPHTAAPLVVAHVATTLVIAAGTASRNVVPFASLGPPFATTTV